MPHHGVVKESTTTKLRIVYNASMPTSNGKSLNDFLAIGKILQSDIITLLTNFRVYKHAFTADLEKMYKQILVDESQRDLQRFVFRFDPSKPLRDYRLTTVTFGMANAPYIAIRVLKEVAERHKMSHSRASSVIESCMYMDDSVSGGHSVGEIIEIYNGLNEVFSQYKFNIRKWCSNTPELLSIIPEADRETETFQVKALGIGWSPIGDTFSFKVSIPTETVPATKRELTSEIASLFDPLGWISPVVIRAKHLLQLLWKQKLGWDEKIPKNCFDEIVKPWLEIKSQLHMILNLKIPRWIKYSPLASVELHAFSDASEVGFACNIYLKVIHQDGTIDINLLCAKSRVAPLKIESKPEATIPRLELSGAFLLANLTGHIIETLPIKIAKVCCYTDSKIVLAWLQGNPKRWKSFVGTRVTKITKLIPAKNWFHVVSEQNPADCASRGILPSELVSHPLWWHGPDFLRSDKPVAYEVISMTDPPERRDEIKSNVATNELIFPEAGSFDELKVIVAQRERQSVASDAISNDEPFSPGEMERAEKTIIKELQSEYYADEIKLLKSGKKLQKSNQLIGLSPFLDENDILRVVYPGPTFLMMLSIKF